MRLLRDLWATSPRRTAVVALLVTLGAIGQSAAAALAGPVLLQRSASLFAILAAALVVAVLSDLAIGLVTAALTAEWTADVRRRLCRVAFGQDLPTLETVPVGELLDRIDGDVNQVASELRNHGVRIVQMVATGLLSVVTAFVVCWPAGVALLALTVLLVAGLQRSIRAIVPARIGEEEAWSDLAAVMEESIHGQDDVRTSLARPYVLRMYAQRASQVLARGRVVWRLSALVTVHAAVVSRLGIASIVATGAWALATDRIDGARLTAVWLLALAFGSTAEHVCRMLPEIQYALGAWARVQLLSDARQEPSGGDRPTDGDLDIRDLTFTYQTCRPATGNTTTPSGDTTTATGNTTTPSGATTTATGDTTAAASDAGATGQDRPALRDLRLTFRRGRSYALIGRTGSGKSTLAKVLTRAVEVPRGSVFLADTDLVDLDIEELRRWIAVVPQRTEILSGTLAENIALFDPQLLDAATHAVHELGLTSWVNDLPDGMRTRLGDGGHVLSAGQEQLVAFARILVRDPKIVILDEATARMDPVTEERVQRATERLMRHRIGIIVAHRLSSVRRCDEVVVLADGAVVEAGPLRESKRYASLMATGTATGAPTPGATTAATAGITTAATASVTTAATASVTTAATASVATGASVAIAAGASMAGGAATATATVVAQRPDAAEARLAEAPIVLAAAPKTDPPPLPTSPPARTMREIFRLTTNDPRYILGAVGFFLVIVLLGLDGSVLPWLWADLVDGSGSTFWPTVAIVAALVVVLPVPYFTGLWFPEWWVRQMLRISLRLVHGQTGPRRISDHTPAAVVAQGGDTERVIMLADNLVDQFIVVVILVSMTWVADSPVPALFFAATSLLSGLAATAFGPALERTARRTVSARARFSTALVSSLSAARTVKLAAATRPVLANLAHLDDLRNRRHLRELMTQVWSRSTPALVSGLLPIGAWAMYLSGELSAAATLIAVSTLGAARWFAWTTSSLVSQLPSARVWTRRTVEMCGVAAYSASVAGVDLSKGTAPTPPAPPRHPLRTLELSGFTAVHEDGTIGVSGVDLVVDRGQLVLVTGPVGSGKSSLLRALAGIVHHTGALRWNGQPVTEPELFLRPNQVGYVAQLPRVLSGTISDNIRLGHEVDASGAVSTAQLDYDLAGTASGLGLLIGHKGTRLSGGQLQRLALARALAPRTELLVADDVSSALDVTTELELWRALRGHGVTVIGSTSKRVALAQADRVVVLVAGEVAAQGRWSELSDRWGHLAG